MTVAVKIAAILICYASFCYAFNFIRFARQGSGVTLKQYSVHEQQLYNSASPKRMPSSSLRYQKR